MILEFFKYHGLGNDYVLFDETKKTTGLASKPKELQKICRRNFGVGSDGVLFVLPSKTADLRMRMFNPDGSEAEMCGNGIRCVAKYACDHLKLSKNPFTVETLGGIKKLEITKGSGGLVESVSVDMGCAVFEKNSTEKIVVEGGEFEFTPVSMGNPHAVIFVQGDAMLEHSFVSKYGPLIEKHARFPKKTNAEFAKIISPTEGNMVVWERGAGITFACGTGTCATVAAGARLGKFSFNKWVKMHLDGGDLEISVSNEFGVLMKGPATEVFRGTIEV